MKDHADTIENISRILGCSNATALAEKLEVTRAAVSLWKKNGIPKKVLQQISEMTGQTVEMLLAVPDGQPAESGKRTRKASAQESAIFEVMKVLMTNPRQSFSPRKASEVFWNLFEAIKDGLDGETTKERICQIIDDVAAFPPECRDPSSKGISVAIELMQFQHDCGRNIESVTAISRENSYPGGVRMWDVKLLMEGDKLQLPPELDVPALKSACFNLAKNTMWRRKPVDLAEIQTHADNLYKETVELQEYVIRQGRDPNMVTRAVQYLDRTHAIPPMENDVRWFYNMITAVIELACPNAIQSKKSMAIFEDIGEGMTKARTTHESSR
jgi:hypothetical protein